MGDVCVPMERPIHRWEEGGFFFLLCVLKKPSGFLEYAICEDEGGGGVLVWNMMVSAEKSQNFERWGDDKTILV